MQLACAFRYGREDLDVIGVSFRKDIWIKRIQMYPFEGTKPPNTPMQEALLKKAGDQGHAFTFDVNSHLCIKHWENNQGCPSLVSLLLCIRFQHIFHAQCPFNQHQRTPGRYSSRKTCTCTQTENYDSLICNVYFYSLVGLTMKSKPILQMKKTRQMKKLTRSMYGSILT